MKLTEKHVQKAIAEYLTTRGFLVIRVNGGGIQQTYQGRKRWVNFARWIYRGMGGWLTGGISDIMAIGHGLFIAVEVKAPGKLDGLSDLQEKFLDAVNACGFIGMAADDVERVIEVVEKLIK